jgi:hypothetical protein
MCGAQNVRASAPNRLESRTFVVSAVALALIDRYLSPKAAVEDTAERARVEASGP